MIPHLSALFLIPLSVWAVPCTQQSPDPQVSIEGKLSERASTLPAALQSLFGGSGNPPTRASIAAAEMALNSSAASVKAGRIAVKTGGLYCAQRITLREPWMTRFAR